jgi:hypothetical protein
MGKKAKINLKNGFANFFGGIGYFFVALQWAWSAMLYSGLLVSFAQYIKPNVTQQSEPVVQTVSTGQASSSFLMIFVAIVVVIIFIITIYVFVKMPSTTANVTKKIVHRTAEYTTPLVLSVQHENDTKVNHSRTKQKLIIVMKVAMVIIPLVLAACSVYLETQKIDYYIAVYASFCLAGFSVALFGIQYIIARFFSLKLRDLW